MFSLYSLWVKTVRSVYLKGFSEGTFLQLPSNKRLRNLQIDSPEDSSEELLNDFLEEFSKELQEVLSGGTPFGTLKEHMKDLLEKKKIAKERQYHVLKYVLEDLQKIS